MSQHFEAVEQEYIPSKENPQAVRIKVSFDIEGKNDRWFNLKPGQVKDWKKHVRQHLKNREADNVPDVTGEKHVL